MRVNPTERFTGRADHYAKFRPGYPRGVIRILENRIAFDKGDVVADIASGTGLLTRLFLENGNRVFAVEPNVGMRSHAEKDLAKFPGFVSVSGTAEQTTLQAGSIDLVTVGQALHWLDPSGTARELKRILKRNGNLCVIYNDRKQDAFGRAYGKVVKSHEKDRATVPNPDDGYVRRFFMEGDYHKFKVPNEQVLEFEGLLGRFLSASYLPARNERSYAGLRRDVKKLFEDYSAKGRVKLRYDTTLYLGSVADKIPRTPRLKDRADLDSSNRLFK